MWWTPGGGHLANAQQGLTCSFLATKPQTKSAQQQANELKEKLLRERIKQMRSSQRGPAATG
jgi:hypothetical protein